MWRDGLERKKFTIESNSERPREKSGEARIFPRTKEEIFEGRN